LASTLNSRFMRSTKISKWSSPIPAIMVCPVSRSDRTTKVGSSSDKRPSALPNFSSSAWDLGSIATEITGSGNRGGSMTMGSFSSERVCPVFVPFKPITAPMFPAVISSTSSRLSACIRKIRPTRSLCLVVEL